MVFERARSFNQRSDALERTIRYNDMLVNRAEGSRALEEQFRSDVHREYSFDSLAAARRYREVDLLHTRALLNFAHAHPLNGVIDMDFVELARQRQDELDRRSADLNNKRDQVGTENEALKRRLPPAHSAGWIRHGDGGSRLGRLDTPRLGAWFQV